MSCVSLLMFLLFAESKIMLDVKPSEIRLRRRTRDARNLPIGRVAEAIHSTESFPSGDLRIENKKCVLLQPSRKKKRRRNRNIALRVILQAQGTSVRRSKIAVVVPNRCRLVIKVPAFRLHIANGFRFLGR